MKKLWSLSVRRGAMLVLVVPVLVLAVPPDVNVACAQGAAPDSVATPPAQPEPEMESAPAAQAPPAKQSQAGFFSRGRVRTGFVVGLGNSFNNTYLILGGGAGYYLVNGLELGASVQAWLLNSPVIWQVSPEARYVLWKLPKFKPYVGGFYRWNFVTDSDTFTSYGGRLGAFYRSNPRLYMGVGAVWEKFNDCEGDCSNVYPEFIVSAGF